jgi:hypothetical protein
MEDVVPLIALGTTLLAVYAAQALAIRKGRSRMGWMWAAALLGPIPLLILLFLPSKLPFEQTPEPES